MVPAAELSAAELTRLDADARERARIYAAEPSKADYAAAFGIVQEGSKWSVPIADPKRFTPDQQRRRMALYVEMTQPKRNLEIARGETVQSRQVRETVRDARTGELREIVGGVTAALAQKPWVASPGVTGRRRRATRRTVLESGHIHIGEPWPWQRDECPGCILEGAR